MSEWFMADWRLQHPVHGSFYVSRLFNNEQWSVTRVYPDPESTTTAVNIVECIATWAYRSVEEAKALVVARIAELDAAMPVAQSEQLEACR